MKSPLISIITITLNAETYLAQTIQSVLNQTYTNIEYIIIDGGSTDNTLSIINKYKACFAHVVSEKDEGIADAMNKGIALATGDYLLFLHADDYFMEHKSLAKALEFLDGNTDILACSIQFGKRNQIYKPRGFNFWTNFKQGIWHQGSICRKSLIKDLNGFDKQFQIAMDFDFFLRAYRRQARVVKAPLILSVMRDIGISSRQDWKSLKTRFDEERKVHIKNCRSSYMNMLYKLYWFLYLPYRYVFHIMRERNLGLSK